MVGEVQKHAVRKAGSFWFSQVVLVAQVLVALCMGHLALAEEVGEGDGQLPCGRSACRLVSKQECNTGLVPACRAGTRQSCLL